MQNFVAPITGGAASNIYSQESILWDVILVFECSVCKKKLKSKQGLFRHIETHLHWSLFKFSCAACEQSFSTNAKLQKHYRNKNHKVATMESGPDTPLHDENDTGFVDRLLEAVSPAGNQYECEGLPEVEIAAPEEATTW